MSMRSVIYFDARGNSGAAYDECQLEIYDGKLVAIHINEISLDLEATGDHVQVTKQLCRVLGDV